MRTVRGWLGTGLRLTLVLALYPAALGKADWEAPALAALVAARRLPPLAERLPERPRILATDPDAVYGAISAC